MLHAVCVEEDPRKEAVSRTDEYLNLAETINSGEWTKFLLGQITEEVKKRLNEPEFRHEPDGNTSEWLYIGGPETHKYWVSVDILT